MRTAIQLTADAGPWPDLVTYVVEAERMGVVVPDARPEASLSTPPPEKSERALS